MSSIEDDLRDEVARLTEQLEQEKIYGSMKFDQVQALTEQVKGLEAALQLMMNAHYHLVDYGLNEKDAKQVRAIARKDRHE